MARTVPSSHEPALPRLAQGERRTLLGALISISVAHTAMAVLTSLLVGRLVSARPGNLAASVVLIVLAVIGMGLTRYAERVTAERLGQAYVHELRNLLVASALSGAGRKPSLGITIARATNDLSSVRSWVAQGIAPLVAAGPLVVGSVLLLGFLHWSLALAAALPLLVLATILWGASRTAYQRARTLRRQRGRLASRLADTLQAQHVIRAAGGEHRELARSSADSQRVVDAAVARSRTAGILQAAAMTTAAAIAALVAVAGRFGPVDPAAVASALTIAGVLASPLAESGRIVAFRQNYRAARRIIAPQIADAPKAADGIRRPRQTAAGVGTVQVDGIPGPAGRGLLTARAGDRLRLVGPDPAATEQLLRRIAVPDDDLIVVVDGWNLAEVDARRRRELVGLASCADPVERGTLARAARYRRPDVKKTTASMMLERVGLAPTIAALPHGEQTELRRGGDPLGPAEVAKLHLARALLSDPPLLLLDRIDSALDADGATRLRELIDGYPGVVVFASDTPERVTGRFRTIVVA